MQIMCGNSEKRRVPCRSGTLDAPAAGSIHFTTGFNCYGPVFQTQSAAIWGDMPTCLL
jgi:hypothetical protein